MTLLIAGAGGPTDTGSRGGVELDSEAFAEYV